MSYSSIYITSRTYIISSTYRPNSHKTATNGVETNLKSGTLIGGKVTPLALNLIFIIILSNQYRVILAS